MPEERKYSVKELQELGLVGQGQKDLIPPHSTGGLLTAPGVRPDMYNAIPRVGNFAQNLPLIPSVNENELAEVLTAQTADSGSNPTNTCGDPAIAGNLKVAQIKAVFGQYYKGTPVYDISKAGLRKDRSDLDRYLLNPRVPVGNPFVPEPVTIDANAINTPVGKMLLELGHSALLDFSYVHFNGDPTKAYNAARLGFIKEYKGLDGWIHDSYADEVSSTDADALNSFVLTGGPVDADLVTQLSDLFRTLRLQADDIGMPNTVWAIVINPRMLFNLVDVWACNYQTARCIVDGVSRQDVATVTTLRDQMYAGRYLLIDGERVPLLYDYGVTATEDTGEYTSDIFIVPMVNNGSPLTYLEYLPYTNAEAAEFLAMGFDQVRVINGGFYLMTFKRTGFCMSYQVTARPRLIMRTPFLAGRIDDVTFTPTVSFNTPIIGDPGYRGGGVATR